MEYFISDLHFGHKNIIKFDNRPFFSVEEMNSTLINNWNSVVTNKDTVYHLGDFCWGNIEEWEKILKSLNGNKVLIQGNHDLREYPANIKKLVADIKPYKEFKANGRTIIMSHYPILAYKHSYDPHVFMFYGHVHKTKEHDWILKFTKELINGHQNQYDNRGQLINVGCMMPYMNYTPQTADYLIEKFHDGTALNL